MSNKLLFVNNSFVFLEGVFLTVSVTLRKLMA